MAAADQFVFNLWFATSTRVFLSKHVPEVLIKWPNDMYVHDHKLAGDLTEHSVSGGRLDFTVAGIGIDVNEERFRKRFPTPPRCSSKRDSISRWRRCWTSTSASCGSAVRC